MKESKNNDSSRRDFIKTSAKIALGSTLVGGVTPQQKAQGAPANQIPGEQVIGRPGPDDPADHPEKQKYFKGKMKLPGWLPDTTEFPGDDMKSYTFFPEEAIHQDKTNGFDAFLPPGSQSPFEDPFPILGAPFNKDPNDPNNKFNLLVEEIARCARNYNAALYWMRRLHFHLKHSLYGSAFRINTAPPRNPHGNKDEDPNNDLANWKSPDFLIPDPTDNQNPIAKAQTRWKAAVADLKNALTPEFDTPPTTPPHPPYPTKPFKQIWADMVQVNRYIISMRIVADEQAYTGDPSIRELGGSSSSYISISSAFSSK